MGLSSDLISQFVKVTNDSKKKVKETTVYGTVKIIEEKPFVQLDGSSILTPATTTSSIRDGNRVTVLIKNHSAIITGNVTSPSASSEMLNTLANDLGLVGDDLAGISSDFDLLVRNVTEINDDLVETGQHVVNLEQLTSGIKKNTNGNYILNGFEVGANKVLFSSSGLYMTDAHNIKLSEPISKQKNGVVFVFSQFDKAANNGVDADWNCSFVPKQMVALHPGRGHSFIQTAGSTFWILGSKHIYIHDDRITGYSANGSDGTSESGIKYTNSQFVLRYVIGV